MSQLARLRVIDAKLVRAFGKGGVSDAAMYTPATGGPAVPCSVYVDRTASFTDAAGNSIVINDAITVTAFAADIGTEPKSGAYFIVGTERFTVDAISNKDESRFVCIVKVGV